MRNVGIIGDGPTDREIFERVFECLFEDADIYKLGRQNLANHIARYWKEANANKFESYFLPNPAAVKLQNSATNLILGAFNDFLSMAGALSDKDVLVITTDSERPLKTSDTYFEQWAFCLNKILLGAVEKFYHAQIRQGYSRTQLPLIIPLALFPSTEICVAVAKKMKNVHGKKAPESRMLFQHLMFSRL